MSFIGTFRQRRWRRTVALVLVAWFNLALQPCAMAMQADDEAPCAPCPQTQSQEQAAHHADADSAPCFTADTDCQVLDELLPQESARDLPGDQALAKAPSGFTDMSSASATRLHYFRPDSLLPGHPPPLSVLYCVYLD